MTTPQALLEKIKALPPERLGEVEDFVDFLIAKSRRMAALDRLLAIAPGLEAAGAPALTEEEVQAEVDAVRAHPGQGKGPGFFKQECGHFDAASASTGLTR